MVNVDVNRSIQFVSLDTHPANNALVVTYEIMASVLDSGSQRELDRRNKRHQIQVKLSVLDRLSEKDLRADQLALDLGELSTEILAKCPLLGSASGRQRTKLEEEIRLHLLYLIGRRRTQLLAPRVGSSCGAPRDRPPSSLARLRSAGQLQQQAMSGRRLTGSASQRGGGGGGSGLSGCDMAIDAAATADVYSHLLVREISGSSYDDLFLGSYIDQLDERLSKAEASLKIPTTTVTLPPPGPIANRDSQLASIQQELEIQLEGLYGDREERLTSMAIIRKLSKRDENLAAMASNRLLVCALLRTLRDSELREQHLSESILYCLIWLTTYQDLYKLSFATEKDPIELERILAELLIDHVKFLESRALEANEATNHSAHKSLEESHFYTNSLLMIMVNLIRLEQSASGSIKGIIFTIIQGQPSKQQQTKRNLVGSLVGLFQLLAKHLTRCIRFMAKLEPTLVQLSNLILILRHLSLFRDFICQLRSVQAPQFVDSLIGLLNTLQLSRPGSGGAGTQGSSNSNSSSSSSSSVGNQQLHQQLITDKQTIKLLYLLEMDLLKLVNNLLLDQRLKLRLIRRNLLKCMLRNLVVLLANSGGHPNTLKPFQSSSVLMVPFKGLYKLSCHELVKGELYKSKIIIKCLLEFLLSATMDLKQALEFSCLSLASSGGANLLSTKSTPDRPGKLEKQQQQQQQQVAAAAAAAVEFELEDQIVLEPDCAAHYIVSLWANLSSKAEATIYGNDSELLALACEYVHLNLANLHAFLLLVSNDGDDNKNGPQSADHDGDHDHHDNHDHHHNLRLMVYIHAKLLRNLSQHLKPEMDLTLVGWTQQLSSTMGKFLTRPHDLMSALSIECLATLSNLLHTQEIIGEGEEGGAVAGDTMGPLIGRLFELDCGQFGAENDDFLLVSTMLMANVARKREICNDKTLNNIGMKIIETSNFILDSRTTTDHQMIIGCLYALGQFMNHSSFLKQLSRHLGTLNGASIERLVEKLTGLVLGCMNLMVVKLSIMLLNNLGQLEQQLSIESPVYGGRFSTYNNKWLAAIQASGEDQREMSATGSANDNWMLDDNGLVADYESADDDDDDDDDCRVGDPSQLQALDSAHTDRGGSKSSNLQIGAGVRVGSEGGSDAEEDDDNYDDDDDDDDDYDDCDSLTAPDLNVIDSNSMIKHLVSMRELRSSKWPANGNG